MKNCLLYLGMIFFLTSCGYKVTRAGYKPGKITNTDCLVVIKKKAKITTDEATLLGEVRLKDSGFTTECGEATAILKLKEEACAIGADLINITNEQTAGLSSSCYRCEAKLYKVKRDDNDSSYARERVFADNKTHNFTDDQLKEISGREKKNSKNRLVGILIGSFIGGIVAGWLVGS